jgi:hypothetical protein
VTSSDIGSCWKHEALCLFAYFAIGEPELILVVRFGGMSGIMGAEGTFTLNGFS